LNIGHHFTKKTRNDSSGKEKARLVNFIKIVFSTINQAKRTKYKFLPSGRKRQIGVLGLFLILQEISRKQPFNGVQDGYLQSNQSNHLILKIWLSACWYEESVAKTDDCLQCYISSHPEITKPHRSEAATGLPNEIRTTTGCHQPS